MIISASRRTDIPAFYADWMMNRIREGFCDVPNPFNRKQISHVSLLPSDVPAIVFWTRNPKPLMRHLGELDAMEQRYYFQFTILGYPREIDRKCPSLETAVQIFRELSDRVGPNRVVWRYDPIVLGEKTPPDYHKRRFARISDELAGYTHRVVVSIVDRYRKAEPRMRVLEKLGAGVAPCDPGNFGSLMRDLAATAGGNGMKITSCAEERDLAHHGILPGRCIDNALIAEAFELEVPPEKDRSQREACRCVASRDIGMYDSCLFGRAYCYATRNFERAAENYRKHDPQSPSLLR